MDDKVNVPVPQPRYSPISLDLGGQNTGIYLAQTNSDGEVDTHGAVVYLPSDKLTWSQKNRLAKRHQRRAITRKHLVRRLLWQILEQYYSINYDTLGKETTEFINGLLRRRGFTYLSLDDGVNPEDFSNLSADPYLDLLPHCEFARRNKFVSLADLLKYLGTEVDACKSISSDLSAAMADMGGSKGITKHFKALVEEEGISGSVEDYKEGFDALSDTADSTIKAIEGGHKARWTYFENIESDIASSTLLSGMFSTTGLDACGFTRLVSNLSNLQLRVLRRYFNDPAEKKGVKFDDEKLRKVILRWILSWHVPASQKGIQHTLCETISKAKSAVAWLESTDPKLTIPPFEDQDNRRPTADPTLLLDDGRLTKLFPQWREIADRLMDAETEIASGGDRAKVSMLGDLDEICALPDRKAGNEYLTAIMRRDKVAMSSIHPFPSFEDKKRMYFLSRVFDRSKSIDPYKCRELSRIGFTTLQDGTDVTLEAKDAYGYLVRALHGDSILTRTFLELADKYYSDVALARSGLWLDRGDTIFRTSGLNTPRKAKIKHLLVGNILGEPFDALQWGEYETRLEEIKLGRAGFWNALESVENIRKSFGNTFAEEYDEECRSVSREKTLMNAKRAKGKAPKLTDDQKALRKVIAITEMATETIAKILGHDATHRDRYNNPFSLAQLYLHARGDIAGSSSTCEAVARENQWRGTMLRFGSEQVARCSRMTADSTRPFDGALARMLDRQARRIADLKFEQLGSIPAGKVDIPIFLEENAFTFTEGVNMVKTNKKPQGKLLRKLDRMQQRQAAWADKDERIRRASKGICPYTGVALGDSGEIDHIIPRSRTKKISGTVFNHEANLIFCSNTGNIAKGDRVFGIENLSGKYLDAVYGTTDIASIKATICKTMTTLRDRRDVVFQSLSEEEQRDVRHALFLYSVPEAYHAALDLLRTQQKARVNGTQAYLAKRICTFLDKTISTSKPGIEPRFSVIRVPAESISDLRRRLATSDESWNKIHPQPVSSHVIDAMLALVCGEYNEPGRVSYSESMDEDEFAKFLSGLVPARIDVLQQARKDPCELEDLSGRALFNDNPYQEHFIPVWSWQRKICVGFDAKALSSVKSRVAEKFYESVREFLTLPEGVSEAPATFAEFLDSPGCWPIDKQKAIAWLYDFDRAPRSESLYVYENLNALRYVVNKIDVISKGIFPEEKKVDFKNIGKKIADAVVSSPIFDSGVALPLQDAWKRLEASLKAAGIHDGDNDAQAIRAAVRKFFCACKSPTRHHAKVRKVFSLPVKTSPAGTCVRIRRKDWRGAFVYQLVTSTAFASGFAMAPDGSADFALPMRNAAADKSKGLGFIGNQFSAVDVPTVRMNEWRRVVDIPDEMREVVTSLELCPNSKDRMRVRCTLSWSAIEKASRELAAADPKKQALTSPYSAMASMPKEIAKLCGLWESRSELFVHRIEADSVSFSYIVATTPSSMRALYNASAPVKAKA